jgi:hypothetical protein
VVDTSRKLDTAGTGDAQTERYVIEGRSLALLTRTRA